METIKILETLRDEIIERTRNQHNLKVNPVAKITLFEIAIAINNTVKKLIKQEKKNEKSK